MANSWHVAVVSSDLQNREKVSAILSQQEIDPICVSTVSQCREILEIGNIDLIFCDWHLPDGDYRDVLGAIDRIAPNRNAKLVVMSGLLRPHAYHQARRQGVFEIIPVPCHPTNIEWMVILAKRTERTNLKEFRHSRTRSITGAAIS
jgi:DNA-binding NtrC family response regulator